MTNFSIPSQQQVDDAIRQMPTFQLRRVFFEDLQNPHLVRALKKAGQFTSPPEPVTDNTGVREMFWPEIDYLERMAALVPDDVVDVLLEIGRSNNSWVRRGIVSIASTIPANTAARLGPVFRSWYPNSFGWRTDPHHLAAVVCNFLNGGQRRLGVSLANALFRPRANPNDSGSQVDPVTTMEEYWYEQELPSVVEALSDDALKVVLPWLELFESLSGRVTDQSDFSYFGRPTIRSRSGNHGDVEHALIDAVRDSAIESAKRDPEGTLAALLLSGQLLTKKILFFAFAEAISQSEGATASNLVAVVTPLLAQTDSGDAHLRIEYSELVRAVSAVSPELMDALIPLVEAGPFGSPEQLAEHMQRDDESEEDRSERMERITANWRHRLLATIGAESLPEPLKARLSELDQELGVIENPLQSEFGITTSWTGPTSPSHQFEMSTKSPNELVELLANWHPEQDWMAPSHEGQSRELSALIVANPDALHGETDLVQRLRPTYLRAVLRGWGEALKAKSELPWEEVVDLGRAVLEHGDKSNFEPEGARFDDDTDYVNAKDAALSLFEEIAKNDKEHPRPREAIDRIVPLVLELTHDDTLREEYLRSAESSFDPLTLSINRRWPALIRTLINLTSWDSYGGERSGVLDAVDAQLQLEDPFGAAAAVVGDSLAKLYVWDRPWLEAHARSLFGSEDSLSESQQIALSTALATQQIHAEFLEILRPSLMAAIPLGAEIKVGWGGLRSTEQLIGEWIIVVYTRQQIEIDDPLMIEFFTGPSIEVRGAALGHVAWNFMHSGSVPDDIRDRLGTLWDSRVAHVRDNSDDAGELADFYWLVRSEKFEAEWWLPRLLEAIQLHGALKTHGMIGDQLAQAAQSNPRAVFDVLAALIRGRQEDFPGENYDLTENAVPLALAAALDSRDASLEVEARVFMDELGEAGHTNLENRVNALRSTD
jgi:hypothetical protein